MDTVVGMAVITTVYVVIAKKVMMTMSTTITWDNAGILILYIGYYLWGHCVVFDYVDIMSQMGIQINQTSKMGD